MSSRRLENMSWRRLQRNNFSSYGRLARDLEDVLEDVNLLRWRSVEDVFKTCLQDVLKTFWRPTNVCWDGFGSKLRFDFESIKK